ncbi:tetrapyrrole biosynthesis, uroporphyrinogen III synthase [Teratosphaeria nubilosa]|uniref:Tetrapyrrole biosynthesis, uroporphyrinogen III synthase n=1 Tax=Teratosphaeria nubilosa TaxID=161662 RepID=A0A6G1LLY4_9PEZI|nr:tetrapyrrole biosynthesis, uroporphyrinogen III synthase [Teratosphaeria nubilosa]
MDPITSSLADLQLNQTPIYLLKTKSSPTDTYHDHFATLPTNQYHPIFIPVLDHMFRDDALRTLRRSAERFAFAGGSPANPAKLRKATHNPAKKYSGIIFTSQRAVDAFALTILKLDPHKLDAYFDQSMPLYAVGPATAQSLRSLHLPCPVLGSETGNGDALAAFILTHRASLPQDVTHLDNQPLPLLFLVGEQRRDIIPKTLQSPSLPSHSRTPVTELVVYETGESATFEESFTAVVQEAQRRKVREQWVVVFSPQGCEAMLMGLGWLDEKGGKFSQLRRDAGARLGGTKTYVATIGPTTREHLLREFEFEPDVVAARPSPEGVAEGVLGFERTSS